MLMFQTITEPALFLQTAESHLGHQAALYNMLLGQARRLVKQPNPNAWCAHGWEEQDHLLVFQSSPQTPLFLGGTASEKLLRRLCQVYVQTGRPLTEVRGPTTLMAHFTHLWEQITGNTHQSSMLLGVYELRQVLKPPTAQGQLRWAEASDQPLLVEWLAGFIRDALGQTPPSLEERNTMVQSHMGKQTLGLWEHLGQPMAMAAVVRHLRQGVAISWVYTPPEERGKGWASACVAAFSQAMLKRGHLFCCLNTDMANPTSNRIYQQIGYQLVGQFVQVNF